MATTIYMHGYMYTHVYRDILIPLSPRRQSYTHQTHFQTKSPTTIKGLACFPLMMVMGPWRQHVGRLTAKTMAKLHDGSYPEASTTSP